jgi:hypothetical protein
MLTAADLDVENCRPSDFYNGLLARYYVDYIAAHPNQEFTKHIYKRTWSAGRKVERPVHPRSPARASTRTATRQSPLWNEGGPVPRSLEAVVGVDGSKIVECSEDPLHMTPIEDWLRSSSHRVTKKSNSASRPAAK